MWISCKTNAREIEINADHIRAMSDEELLKFFCKVSDYAGCPPTKRIKCVDNCEHCWRIYLRLPAEED